MSKARLRHDELGLTLRLPWWPSEVSRELRVRTLAQFDRPDLPPLVIPDSLTNGGHSVSYLLRNEAFNESVAGHLATLATLAADPRPVTLLLGDDNRGKWHLEAVSVVEVSHADDGTPSVADVSMTFRQASPATVNVGLIKRERHARGQFVKAARRKRTWPD